MIKLIHGDCLQEMDRLIEKDVWVDAIITDPPYGTTACKWDSVIPFNEMWERLNKLIKPNGAIVLFGSEPFSSALRMSNIKNYKYDWKWDKVIGAGFASCNKRPLIVFEDICVFYSKQPTYNPIMTERNKKNERPPKKPSYNNITGMKTYDQGTVGKKKYPINKIIFNKQSKELNSAKIIHPTQKPLDVMEYLIKTYTNEGETVLDFTAGSGTTGVACKNLNRSFIGIELDEKYFGIAKERIKNCDKVAR